MNRIPTSWALAPLDALGQWGSGGTPTRTNSAYHEGGGIPWLVIGDLNDGTVMRSSSKITERGLANSSAKLLPVGTLLVAMYGSIGKLGVTGIECATNQAIAYCKPDPEVAQLQYLFYVLRNAKAALIAKGQGGAQQNISQGILRQHEVPIAPLNEQTRIANKLDAVLARVDACRERLDRVAGLLTRLRQSALADATSGRLTWGWRQGNARAEANVAASAGAVSDVAAQTRPPDASHLPAGWKVASLAELCQQLVDGSHNPPKASLAGHPMLSARNIQAGRIVFSEYRLIREDDFTRENSRTRIAPGDVLLTIVGTIGRTAVVPQDASPFALQRSVAVLKPLGEIRSSYLALALESPERQHFLEANAKGTAQKGIYLGALGRLELPVPPIEEQDEIIRRVDALLATVERLDSRATAALSRLEQIVPALLAAAFRGELVPQDPADEPASALLERSESARPSGIQTPPARIHRRAATNRTRRRARA